MAKIYSLEYLRLIHKKGEASNGVIYQTEDDRQDDIKDAIRYFQGDENGRLEEVTDITLIEDNSINIDTNTTDISDLIKEDLRLEAIKADKCYVVAMSIIL